PGWIPNPSLEISHESPGSSQCLLEHLLTRLQSSSCHVKLKVLKILLHTCSQGSPQFVLQLKRNASFIREAAVFSGPPDPLHGNSLNQKVRAAAQVGAGGTGQPPAPCSGDPGVPSTASAPLFWGVPAPSWGMWGPHLSSAVPAVSHQAGLAGGGWEEADSGHSSRESSQGNERSRASDSGSKSGSDSRSGASRELSHGTDRVDADSPGDCRRELSLVSGLTRGARVFLTREEAQHFLKECGLLNCEVVLELLGRALEDPSDSVRMRSMCAISALGCSDLLSPEQIFAVTRQRLQHLSQGSPGPVANRATKMLRQFEALCRAQPSPKAPRPPSAPSAGSAGDLLMDIPAVASQSFLTPLS
ncbi:AP4AT protein, partial [Vidua macroura]|nr:AP4AT protein [Vidua macroura]